MAFFMQKIMSQQKIILIMEQEIALLSQELDRLKKALVVLKQHADSSTHRSYDKSWSFTKKIKYVLHQNGKIMTPREILSEIFLFEPELEVDKPTTNLLSTRVASYIINNMKHLNKKKVLFVRAFKDETKVGLKEWFNIDGVIKKEHI